MLLADSMNIGKAIRENMVLVGEGAIISPIVIIIQKEDKEKIMILCL